MLLTLSTMINIRTAPITKTVACVRQARACGGERFSLSGGACDSTPFFAGSISMPFLGKTGAAEGLAPNKKALLLDNH